MAVSYTAIAVATAALWLLWKLLRIGRRPKDFPPGPPTIPILGNLHQMPSRDVHLQYQRWAQEYGPIYSLMMGAKPFIIISSDEVYKELFDRRSHIYSDRMEHYLAQEIISSGNRMIMLRYGPKWRMTRKLTHELLNTRVSQSYLPYQDLENKQMLLEMLDQPKEFQQSLRRYGMSLTTQMVYGFRTISFEDPRLVEVIDNVVEFAATCATPTAFLLDVFPILRKLPDFLLPPVRRAKERRKRDKALFLGHWMDCKDRADKRTAMPCFCINALAMQKQEGFTDQLGAYLAGSMLEAGAETTSNSLYSFVQAMMLFPDVQKKAQQYIDAIVGDDCLPTMEDYSRLPYIKSCIKENLRWGPIAILGFPHAVMEDDVYQSYRIPKGAGIIGNVYTISMDPQRHPDPRTFDPDRYSDDLLSLADSATSSDPSKRDTFNFGGGRRICPGIHLAERSLFLGIARILWAFDISPAKDENGLDIIPDPDLVNQGFLGGPLPFSATIRVRSSKKEEVIRENWREAQTLLDPKTKQWVKVPESLTKRRE